YMSIITGSLYGGFTFYEPTSSGNSYANLSAAAVIGSAYLDDFFANRLTYNKAYQNSAIPTFGSYRENAIAWNTTTNGGGTTGWLCSGRGTMDANPPSITVSTNSTTTVTITAATNFDFVDGDVSVANNTITENGHPFSTGDIVILSTTGVLPGGLSVSALKTYYVIDDTANTIKLATSAALAAVPTAIDITSAAGGGTHAATSTVLPGQYIDLSGGDVNKEIATGWTAIANDATPSVLNLEKVVSGGTTTITDFDDGVSGQELKLYAAHSLTITDGTNIFLSGSANWAMTATDMLHLIQRTDGKWYEIGRGDNGA
ncbi:hypothetical protein LCGC14_1708150, partial [marine sediment metagenome]